MDAIATRQDPTTAGSRRAHQGVGGLRRFRQHVRPWGLRLEVTPAAWAAGGVPCQHTTPWAAHLMREVNAPAGVKVSVWCAAEDRGPTGGTVCRDKRCHVAAPLQRPRRLCKPGWNLTAGREGRQQCRRRRTDTLVITTPPGRARYRGVEAGWLEVSLLGSLHVVVSRQGTAITILGLVTDPP
jgi:hypothetical protein